jgi:hypothetical protein
VTIKVCLVAGTLLALNGCAQMTTSASDEARLQRAAEEAGEAYVNCILDASERYQQTNEPASVIVEVARKACTAARAEYVTTGTRFLKTRYMSTEPIVQREATALEERAALLIQQRVLSRKSATPATPAPAAPPPAASIPTNDGAYLECMQAQGRRYAALDEPAEVIAEVAHSRCAVSLADRTTGGPVERQGRALVMGMVLDRKASQP